MEINTDQLKPWIWQALGVLLCAFLLLAVIDKVQVLSKNINSRPDNTISMTGEGKVSSVPDLATITVGVTANASTVKAAADDVNKKLTQITDTVKALGVDAKDIATSNYSVNPNYDYNSGAQKITGYIANQAITIKVRDVDKSTDKVSKILDGATTSGGNQIQGVYFSFDDADALKQEARKMAIEKAKQKAQELASATGLKLGKVVSVSEGGGYTPYPMPYAMDSKAVGMGGGITSAPSIETGSQDIVVQMTLVFELK